MASLDKTGFRMKATRELFKMLLVSKFIEFELLDKFWKKFFFPNEKSSTDVSMTLTCKSEKKKCEKNEKKMKRKKIRRGKILHFNTQTDQNKKTKYCLPICRIYLKVERKFQYFLHYIVSKIWIWTNIRLFASMFSQIYRINFPKHSSIFMNRCIKQWKR